MIHVLITLRLITNEMPFEMLKKLTEKSLRMEVEEPFKKDVRLILFKDFLEAITEVK